HTPSPCPLSGVSFSLSFSNLHPTPHLAPPRRRLTPPHPHLAASLPSSHRGSFLRVLLANSPTIQRGGGREGKARSRSMAAAALLNFSTSAWPSERGGPSVSSPAACMDLREEIVRGQRTEHAAGRHRAEQPASSTDPQVSGRGGWWRRPPGIVTHPSSPCGSTWCSTSSSPTCSDRSKFRVCEGRRIHFLSVELVRIVPIL
ncbi:unnamed protein product, partial [Urochloa humidicola]